MVEHKNIDNGDRIENMNEATINKKDELKKFIKFGITGGLNSLVDFCIFTLLAQFLGVNTYFSQVVSYSAGTLNSYIINKSWTFKSKDKFLSKKLIKFIVINLITLGLSIVGLYFMHDLLSINKIISKLIVMGVTTCFNFIGNRIWVFK